MLNQRVRRTLSISLSAVLALSVFTAPAFAAPPPRPKPPAKLKAVGGQDAVGHAGPKDTEPAVTAAPKVTWPSSEPADIVVANPPTNRSAASDTHWAAGPAVGVRKAAGAPGSTARLRVQALSHDDARRAGRDVVVRIKPGDTASAGAASVSIDYNAYKQAYGGNWFRRLSLVALPECALSTPDAPGCQATPLASTNNESAGVVTADMALAAPAGALVALASGPSSDGGSFKATSVQPTGTWDVGASSGDFSWKYPLRLPPSLGGPAPDIALTYAGQSIDGQTSASNSQPSWVGEGFSYDPGFIERSYRTCKDDGQAGRDDLCWAGDNATMTLNGRSTPLLWDAVKKLWVPKADDGSKIELLKDGSLLNGDDDGEYWKVTTPEGMQYFFGLHHLPGWQSGNAETNSVFYEPVFGNNANEPCNSTTGGFAASSCQQAYRWNLDYVVDPHFNTMSYYYLRETNKYGRNQVSSDAVTYVRGGTLKEIDYGTRQVGGVDSVFAGTAPQRVEFETTDRCVTAGATCTLTSANAANWPDVPVDLVCSGSSCPGQYAPTFFTTKKLSKVTTEVASGAKAWRRVEQWRPTQEFKSPGDANPSILWMSKLEHCGTTDSTCMPATTFVPTQLSNRVDPAGGTDSIIRYRMSSINTDTGGTISVTYSAPECSTAAGGLPSSPDANIKRCFPVWWTPPGSTTPKMEYFHRYVVKSVATGDNVGGGVDQVEYLNYLGSPAWHYVDDPMAIPAHRTWGEWRGYGQVEVLHGANDQTQSRTVTTYFRGMNGDKTATGTRSVTVADSDGGTWADDDWLAGVERESVKYLGTTSTVVSKVKLDPYKFGPTATQGLNGSTANAYATSTAVTTTTTALDMGRGNRTTKITNSFIADRTARVSQVDDEGDLATTADDRCTRTTYASNAAGTLLTAVARNETVAVRCATTPDRSTQVISDARTWFDNAASFGTTVSKGDVTRTELLSDWNGGSPKYQQQTRAQYDDNGRPTLTYDALDRTTEIAYTPAGIVPVTGTTTKNSKGWTSTVTSDPGWGLPTSTVDENGKRTDTEYDGLGRLANVWEPGRTKGTDSATLKYTYAFHNSGAPNAVTMSKLNTAGTGYFDSYMLYDGLGRLRQSQGPAIGGGRMITETKYDSRGLVSLTRPPFYDANAPGATLRNATDTEVPAQTVHVFDGAERPTADVFQIQAVEKWRTSMYYAGDRVDVTMPAGGVATSTYVNGRGLTSELKQYNGNVPTGTNVDTKYTYTPDGQLATVTDAAGNVWTTTYNQLGQKLKYTDPDQGTTQYTYYDDGQQKTVTDPRGVTLAYQYDELGRLTGRFRDSTSGTQLAKWTYDTAGNPPAKGRLASSIRYDSAGNAYTSTITGYNSTYQVTDSEVTIPATALAGSIAGTYPVHAEYNADGSPKSVSMPTRNGTANFGGLNDETVTYGYSTQGKATTLSGLSTYVTDAEYEQNGQLSLLNLSDRADKNILQYWTYEPGTLRPSNHQVLGDFGANIVAADVTTTYDDAGNVRSIRDAMAQYGGGGTDDNQCFRYDGQRRLTEAWTPASGNCATNPATAGLGGPAKYWTSYRYNDIGNRTQTVRHATGGDSTSTYAYPTSGATATRPHAADSVTTTGPGAGVSSYGYDQAGAVSTRTVPGRPGQTLTWDAEGHVASVADSAGTASYLYDVDGKRLIGKDATGTTLYLGAAEYKAAPNGTVTCTRYYTHGAAGLVAVRTPAGLFWQTSDAQGTSQLSFRSSDLSRTQRRTDPFGGVRGTDPGWVHPHGFVGGTVDPSGLIHLGAREYDPVDGRFISVDPVIQLDHPETLNPYVYSGNNPATFTDPGGESWLSRHLDAIGKTAMACVNTTTLAGIGLMVLGSMIDGTGGLLAVTGVGAIIGVPALALGTELIAAGAALTVTGVALGIANSVASSSGGGGDGGGGDDSSSSSDQPYKYQREMDRLKEEHKGEANDNPLSDVNAKDALERDTPEGTQPRVDDPKAVVKQRGDVNFVDSDGNVVFRREVKTSGAGDRSISGQIEKGAEQVQNDGEVFIQMPRGAGVDAAKAGLRRFQDHVVRKYPGVYNRVRVRIVDPDGRVLVDQLATDPVMDPPTNMGNARGAPL